MRLRKVLASNLRAQMDRNPNLDTQMKVADASGVNQATVSRILRCQFAATLDNLEAIADAFGVHASELIHIGNRGHVMKSDESLTPAELSEIERFVSFVKQRRLGESFTVTTRKAHKHARTAVPKRRRA